MMYAIPTDTPWGEPDEVTEIAPGIIRFDTPGHGGLWLAPEVNATVPMNIKDNSFCGNGHLGWYEEDCDAPVIYVLFGLLPDWMFPDSWDF